MSNNLPIVIIAPTKKKAAKAASRLDLPGKVVLIGNHSLRALEGLIIDRFHTFFVEPHHISWEVMDIVERAWLLRELEES